MTISTKHFHPDTDTKLICTCGHPLCDRRSVRQDVLNQVQLIRYDIDRPLKINSGGRCPYHENEKHRKFPADHQKGVAVDVPYQNGVELYEILEAGFARGMTAFGIYPSFIHLSWRDCKEPVAWVRA